MARRHHLTAAVLSIAALIAAVTPAASAAGTAHQRTTRPSAAAKAHRAAVTSATPALGTVKGKITSADRLKRVNVALYVRKTAEDGSKGWVATDLLFASDGYGVSLNTKTGYYSFKVKPGTYRLEFNGTFRSGHSWGIVGYGPGKPAAAPFGKSITVRKGKATTRINVRAAGDFGNLKLPDPGPSFSPFDPTAGASESVTLGTWPKGTVWYYTWQIGNSNKYLSFKRTVTVPANAAGKSIGVDIYAAAYGKTGAGVSIGTVVGH
jgi:hypothetical protein